MYAGLHAHNLQHLTPIIAVRTGKSSCHMQKNQKKPWFLRNMSHNTEEFQHAKIVVHLNRIYSSIYK